jgi:predicted acylesterase/phospholipase RssA
MKTDTLVLSAGGTYAVAYVGVINCLEMRMTMSGISKFYGTSAGSLVCAMAACGLTSAEMMQIMEVWGRRCTSPGVSDLMRIPEDWGALDVRAVLGPLLDAFLPPEETFVTLAKRRGAMLSVYAYNVTTSTLTEFGINSTPDMPIRDAVLSSCCVPFLYSPMKIGGELYVDGAVTQRTPLHNVPCSKTTLAIDVTEQTAGSPSSLWEYCRRLTTGTSRHVVCSKFDGKFITIRLPDDTPSLLDSPFCHTDLKKLADIGKSAAQAALSAE